MRILFVVGGDNRFIQPVIDIARKSFEEVDVFEKHIEHKNVKFPPKLRHKIIALRNYLTYNSRDLKTRIKKADVVFVEWGALALQQILKYVKKNNLDKKIVGRIHRWEITSGFVKKIDFDKITVAIVTNEWKKYQLFVKVWISHKKIEVIPTLTSLKNYPLYLKPKLTHGLLMVGGRKVKRVDLGAKISEVGNHFTVLGMEKPEPKQFCPSEFIYNFLPSRYLKVHHQMNDFILSCSDDEGFHCAIIEGMSSGLIPIIRGWKGAEDIYPEEIILPYSESAFVREAKEVIRSYWTLSEKDRLKKQKLVSAYARFRINESTTKYLALFKKLRG